MTIDNLFAIIIFLISGSALLVTIRILRITEILHKGKIDGLNVKYHVLEERRNFLEDKLNNRKELYELRMAQKDEIIEQYKFKLETDFQKKVKEANIQVDVTNPHPTELDEDITEKIKEEVNHLERLQKYQFILSPETLWDLFKIYYNKHEYIKAAETMEYVIFSGDMDDKNFFNLGVAYNNGGNLKKALESYEKAVELNPNRDIYRSYYGGVLRKLGQLSKAEVNLKKALNLNPDCDDAHYNLAAIYAIEGKNDECFNHLEKAIQIDPSWKGHVLSRPYFDNIFDNPRFLAIVN